MNTTIAWYEKKSVRNDVIYHGVEERLFVID